MSLVSRLENQLRKAKILGEFLQLVRGVMLPM